MNMSDIAAVASRIRLCGCDNSGAFHNWGDLTTCRRVDAVQIAYDAMRKLDPTGHEAPIRADAYAVVEALDAALLIRRDRATIGDQP